MFAACFMVAYFKHKLKLIALFQMSVWEVIYCGLLLEGEQLVTSMCVTWTWLYVFCNHARFLPGLFIVSLRLKCPYIYEEYTPWIYYCYIDFIVVWIDSHQQCKLFPELLRDIVWCIHTRRKKWLWFKVFLFCLHLYTDWVRPHFLFCVCVTSDYPKNVNAYICLSFTMILTDVLYE